MFQFGVCFDAWFIMCSRVPLGNFPFSFPLTFVSFAFPPPFWFASSFFSIISISLKKKRDQMEKSWKCQDIHTSRATAVPNPYSSTQRLSINFPQPSQEMCLSLWQPMRSDFWEWGKSRQNLGNPEFSTNTPTNAKLTAANIRKTIDLAGNDKYSVTSPSVPHAALYSPWLYADW